MDTRNRHIRIDAQSLPHAPAPEVSGHGFGRRFGADDKRQSIGTERGLALCIGEVDFVVRRTCPVGLPDITDHSNHSQRNPRKPALRKHHLPSHGIFVGPLVARHGLVDDHNRRRLVIIVFRKSAPACKGHPHGLKITGKHHAISGPVLVSGQGRGTAGDLIPIRPHVTIDRDMVDGADRFHTLRAGQIPGNPAEEHGAFDGRIEAGLRSDFEGQQMRGVETGIDGVELLQTPDE